MRDRLPATTKSGGPEGGMPVAPEQSERAAVKRPFLFYELTFSIGLGPYYFGSLDLVRILYTLVECNHGDCIGRILKGGFLT